MVVLEADDRHGVARATAACDIDLAVIDADLPGASDLREGTLGSQVPVVLTTRTPGPVADALAARLRAVGVMRKPIDDDDLRTVVWNLALVRS